MKQYKSGLLFGTFDPLHYGHIRLIRRAASLCEKLYVCIDSDELIKKVKHREPTDILSERIENIKSFKDISFVGVESDEFTKSYWVNYLDPEVLIKGDDWKDKGWDGEKLRKTIYLPHTPNIHSNQIYMQNKQVFYFLGTAPFHIFHARVLYKFLGGEFIVLSKKGEEVCKKENVNYKMLDIHDNAEYFDFSKIGNTLNYLNSKTGVIFFFHTINIFSQLHSLKKIVLCHGNSLKNTFYPRRVEFLKDADHITSLSPHREEIMIKAGIPKEKLLQIGLTRWDQIIKSKQYDKNIIFNKMRCSNKKIITYMPTWWPPYSVEDLGFEIIKQISNEYILVFRPHPDTPTQLLDEYRTIIANKNNILYGSEYKYPDINLLALFSVSDAFIVDMSSVSIDAILTDKPLIYAFGEKKHKDYREATDGITEETFLPIKEIYDKSCKITLDNVSSINEIIEKSFNTTISNEDRNAVKQRMFYNLKGDATETLIKFLENHVKGNL